MDHPPAQRSAILDYLFKGGNDYVSAAEINVIGSPAAAAATEKGE